MLIHIIPGDKFERYAAEQFEAALPGGNRFVVVLPPGGGESAGSGEFECERVVVGTNAYTKLLHDVSRSRCVVFHCYVSRFRELLERCPSSCVTAWVVWGIDVYGAVPRLSRCSFQPMTASLHARQLIERMVPLRVARRLLESSFLAELLMECVDVRRRLLARKHLRSFRRFDYVLTYLDEDAELLHEQRLTRAQHLPFCYFSLERTIGNQLLGTRCASNDILLGNSASLTNNHLDAFEILQKLNLSGRRLVCPLSYGDDAYGRIIADAGRRTFGDAFVPLMDYLPIKEYNSILTNCSVVVMNHLRQQAMGNIITALWLGAKVYLNETTTVWGCLRRIGIRAYSIPRELRSDNPETLDPPPVSVVERNREVLRREFSYDRVLSYCRAIVAEFRRRGAL